ncbi:Putative WD40/YVTN repeat-like-containing domain superfamily [Septoria linicola]|uniref:WD40/YVTN repeat-like-containing domain superfamily n=1 Tax=Septoria linicola TaxID=215465 RepID=A0A9Q9AJ13_9PEZI|nr:putative WD40/YVTN repeat-like-containing domain superfamily [Septoria linicola]USW46806.1 Putative WD40/YVTN repeat-like-containing domain superfamily [Septoria linicola]
MSSSMQQRKEEILAKKAKLAELKRQRELRQKDLSTNRHSLDASDQLVSPSPQRASGSVKREDIESLISSLVDRPSSTTPATPNAKLRSNTTSHHSEDGQTPPPRTSDGPAEPQTLSFAALTTVFEIPVESKPEYITYSKGVQTADGGQQTTADSAEGSAEQSRSTSPSRRRRNLSPRARELQEEEIRQRLRQEIEEELRALQLHEDVVPDRQRFPARALAPEELSAVTSSNDFLDFVERSSKVIERALDEEYDVLADYAAQTRAAEDEDDEYVGRRGRRVKEVASFELQPEMGKKRMISDIDFSPKFPELLCTAYTKSQSSPHTPPGLLNVWNMHLKGRPEYSLHATSDLLSCQFHPFHPSLILGGTYSGQLCLWDTRARNQRTGEPVQKTPLTGGRTGHAHPIYSLATVGTQNASSVVSVSTDGVVCAWSTDILTQPQEYLELHAPNPSAYKTDDVAPTCISFPASDPTYFLAGTEQGSIFPVHRYDRAGAKKGVDTRTSYRGHEAPVTGIDFHPARGKIDLGDLFVSCGLDWSVKVWRARPPSTTSSTISGNTEVVKPLLEIQREDSVYDAKWSPTKPGIFGCVDGSGRFDIYDINASSEVPVGGARPSHQEKDIYALKSLNKLAWEKNQGRHVAVGGLDGVTTVFEVGSELGGVVDTKSDAWLGVKKFVARRTKSKVEM